MILPYRDAAADHLSREYSAKAEAYALYWAPVLRMFTSELLDLLPIQGASRILDVGCGTGDLLRDVASRMPEGARLIGVDRAEGMLRVAQRRGRAPVGLMDARLLALRDRSFDLAICAFVLFHVPNPAAALREIRRILKPGGRVGLAVWGNDPGTPGKPIWDEELERARASPDPRPPEVMGQAAMNTLEKLGEHLKSAGFRLVRATCRRYAYTWSLDSLMSLHIGCGYPSRRLSDLTAEARDECISRVRNRLSLLTRDELVHRPEVLYADAAA